MDNNEQNIPAVSGNVEAGQVSSDAGAQVSGEGMTPIGNGDIGTAEPEMGTMANLAAEKEEAPAEEVTASKTGVVLSSKQSAVISERKDLYKRMVNSYAERFADQAKAPKAKMTDAAHVLKVMREAEKAARNGAKAAGAELDEANEAGQNARDEAYEKARHLPDGPERQALYTRMFRQMEADTPIVLNTSRISNWLVHPWVKGFKKHPILHNNWMYLDIVK